MDPYAIITCLTQEKRSSVASGKGSTPEWNETFLFTISDDVSELRIKIMDSDYLTQDDFVGEATIPLESLFHEGSIPPTSYNVTKDEQYCGEIRVGLTFTRQFVYDRNQMNVLEVNKTDYENCISDHPLHNWTTGAGRDVVPLNMTRKYYFISGKGFCYGGMKFVNFFSSLFYLNISM